MSCSSRLTIFVSLALSSLLPLSAIAEVVKSSEQGFLARNRLIIAAPPAKVWAALIEPARWWNQEHSWSGKAANFSLDARAGGCFCERLADGGSVEHQHVVMVTPNHLLRLTGGLGPLQAEAVNAVLSWELKADGERTIVSQTYAVSGQAAGGLAGWATPVDGVIREQLERLQKLIETGKPDAAAATK
ncbi:SRPBCC family protein [Nevskia ramosa]|uniref:SRPBCC family protein n=1 Tax=Nevskia ramosa TaxID=64002 RepID=UPI002353E9AA|nr:SRPBCC domain-containing protein [Nevskia ramosa]